MSRSRLVIEFNRTATDHKMRGISRPVKQSPALASCPCYIQANRPTEAIESLKKAIELKPDYFQAYNDLGNAFAELGLHKRAPASRECYSSESRVFTGPTQSWSCLF